MADAVVDSSRVNRPWSRGAVRAAALLASGLIGASSACHSPGADAQPPRQVLVFAASSLQTVVEALAAPLRDATGIALRPSYAASAVLARQIERGAPAELFVSADPVWVDYLHARHLTDAAVPIAGNRLVLIASRDRPMAASLAGGLRIAEAIGPDRLAVGDPATVPVGQYAQAALTSLGLWDRLSSQLAPGGSARAVLRHVALGEAPLGIVYETDARAEANVVIVDRFPAASHPPIVYAAALTTSASADARALLIFLQGPVARAVLQREGFSLP